MQNIWHLDILPLVPTNKASATFDKCIFFYVLQFRCKIIGVQLTFVVQDRRNRGGKEGPHSPPPLQILADQLTQIQTGRKERQILPLPFPGFLTLPTALHSIF